MKSKTVYICIDKKDIKATIAHVSIKQVAGLLGISDTTLWRRFKTSPCVENESLCVIKTTLKDDGRADNGYSESIKKYRYRSL